MLIPLTQVAAWIAVWHGSPRLSENAEGFSAPIRGAARLFGLFVGVPVDRRFSVPTMQTPQGLATEGAAGLRMPSVRLSTFSDCWDGAASQSVSAAGLVLGRVSGSDPHAWVECDPTEPADEL